MADMYRTTTIIGGPYVAGGGICELYFDLAGGTAAQAVTCTNMWWNSILAFVGTGTTFAVQAGTDQVDAENGQIIVTYPTTGTTHTGTGGTTIAPPATQTLVSWRTGAYSDGREIRGRTFLPAPLAANVSAGNVLAGAKTSINAAAAAVIADANSTFVIWRRPRKERLQLGVPGQPGYRGPLAARDGEFAPVTTGTCQDKYSVLRGRRD